MKLTEKNSKAISIICQTIIFICSLITLIFTRDNFTRGTSIILLLLSTYLLYIDIK